MVLALVDTGSCRAADWEAHWATVLAYLQGKIAEHGPFDGLLGFSNGGACASSLLCAAPKGTFRFVIICDGHPPQDKGDAGQSTLALLERQRPIKTPALFTIGQVSKFKPLVEALREYWQATISVVETHYHPGGHILPVDPPSLETFAQFLLRQVLE